MEENYKEKYLTAMIRFKKVCNRFPSECDIQWSELLVMEKVCKEPATQSECITVSEIHETLCISKPAVSQTLNNLEKKGFIVRQIDSSDRRKISVQPTNQGKTILNKSVTNYDREIKKLCSAFGQDDMDMLIRLLNRLSDMLDDTGRK